MNLDQQTSMLPFSNLACTNGEYTGSITAGVLGRKIGCLVFGVRVMVGSLGTEAELPAEENRGELVTDPHGVVGVGARVWVPSSFGACACKTKFELISHYWCYRRRQLEKCLRGTIAMFHS